MRVPSFQSFTKWTQAAGLVIAGMIIGAALLLTIVHQSINTYLTENHMMRLEMKLLEENAASKSTNQRIISEIEVYLDDENKAALAPLTVAKLRSLIATDLGVLRGQRVYQISPRTDNGNRVLITLFKEVYPDVDGKAYLVEINHYTIVYGVLTVWAGVQEISSISN